ncbi:MAG TPA: Atxe2 family lasso peptide isopeptidase [Steroidobacteraceae bacterium]
MKGALVAVVLTTLCDQSCYASSVNEVGGSLHDPTALSVRDLVSMSDVGGGVGTLSLSPDGRRVAFQLAQPDLASNSIRLSWWIAPVVDSGSAIRVGDGGAPILNLGPHGYPVGTVADVTAQWSPDGRWIAYLRGDRETTQVWLSGADGAVQEQVTSNAAEVTELKWKDADSIYFEVGRSSALQESADSAESDRGYLLDDRFILDSLRPLWQPCGPDPWGMPRPSDQRCEPQLWIAQLHKAQRKASPAELSAWRALSDPGRPSAVAASRSIKSISWNASHTHVAWLENEDPVDAPGFAAPLTVFADAKRCGRPECHGQLRQVWWSEGKVYWLRQEGPSFSVPAIYEWRPGSRSVRRVYRQDSVLESCVPFDAKVICIRETPAAPRKIVSIELHAGRVSVIYDPNPQFARYKLGRIEKLQWTDAFGHDAFGHLVYPNDYHSGHAYPLVIVQYRSRGFLNGGTGREYPIFPLAARGFMVLSFDEPVDWESLAKLPDGDLQKVVAYEARMRTDSYESRMALSALDNILDRLISEGLVDAGRIGITGLSEGANTVAYALFHSHRYAAAAFSGLWSPTHYFEIANEGTRALVRASMSAGNSDELMRRYKSEALMFNADKVATPLLIQVSDAELLEVVPTFVTLKEAADPVEAYVFPHEYHIKRLPRHKLAVAERAIDWFGFWLMGVEDPDPAKSAQYMRWRSLRAQAQCVARERGAAHGDVRATACGALP